MFGSTPIGAVPIGARRSAVAGDTTTVDAWIVPGAASDIINMPTGIPALAMGAGAPARTIFICRKVNDLDIAARGTLWSARRTSNNNPTHRVVFEPANNNIEYQWGLSQVFEQSTNCETTPEWVWDFVIDEGNDAVLIIRRILHATAAQTHGNGGGPIATGSDDAAAQSYTLGATNNAGSITSVLDGEIAFFGYLPVALTQGECEAMVANPLNVFDDLVATHGTAAYIWDDSGTDIGGNSLGAPSLGGTVTRGTGNGPTVPAREGGEQIIAVGLATEADSVFAVARLKLKAIGLITEADSALAILRRKTRIPGLITEADSALTLGKTKMKLVGLVSESDVAQVASRGVTINVGLAAENDSAFTVAKRKSKIIGLVAESDSSLIITRRKTRSVGLAGENDISLALATKAKLKLVGLANETDTAFPVTRFDPGAGFGALRRGGMHMGSGIWVDDNR